MRKSQKHDEALALLFLEQQTLLKQMRRDRAHNTTSLHTFSTRLVCCRLCLWHPVLILCHIFLVLCFVTIIRRNPQVRCTRRQMLATKKFRRIAK
jgi:hypothetical protein